MSMGMEVYLTEAAEVLAVPGSADDDLFEWLRFTADGDDSLAHLDDDLEVDIEAEYPGFSHAEALRDLIAGRVSRPDAGFVYAYAFEHVCSCFGRRVHNLFHKCPPADLTTLDEQFAAHGVGLRFWGGLVGRPPVPLPDVSDAPLIGHWTEAEVRAAAPAFWAMRAAGPAEESWFDKLLDEVGGWLRAVEAEPGHMLVASYR